MYVRVFIKTQIGPFIKIPCPSNVISAFSYVKLFFNLCGLLKKTPKIPKIGRVTYVRTVGDKKKRHPLKMDILFPLGLNHSAYIKNEQKPPYTDL